MSRLHPHALADHLRTAVPRSTQQPVWTDTDGRLETLFFGHGAPPLLDDPLWMGQLFDWAVSRPKPKAILIVSAHWEDAPLALSAPQAGVPLVYDFGGFEQRFYALTYPTPDASALADRVVRAMPATEPVHRSTTRGLDHGAWVPLMVMYPLGDVPVLQLSLPTHDPQTLLTIGRRLKALPDEGILVLGSGFMTHGLPFLTRSHWTDPDTPPPGWSRDFDLWAQQALAAGDVDTLADYRRAPGMPYAHPTPEHFSPLFVALGLQEPDRAPREVIEGYWMGLAKRAVEIG